MNKYLRCMVRSFFAVIAFLSLFLAYKSLSNDIGGGLMETFLTMPFKLIDVNWDLLIFFLIMAYVFLNIAIYWGDILKKLTTLLVSFAILFLTFSLFFFAFSSNAEEISSSVQPSIDYIIADSFGKLLEGSSNPPNIDLEILLSNDTVIEEIYVNNITSSQVNFFLNSLNMSFDTYEEEETFVKLMITLIDEEIKKNMPEASDAPIPLSQLEKMLGGEKDSSFVDSQIDVSLLEQFYSINNSASITIQVSENVESITINPAFLKDAEANTI